MNHFQDITVVVAVLDEASWICQKIENIMQSSYPLDRIEVVIVDGGSVDGTVELAESFSPGRLRVRVVRCPKRMGKAEQINAGVRASRTEIIVCTDADTMLDRDCITQLVAALNKNKLADVIGARIVPVTRLIEEQIHWHVVNLIWWLEGRAFHSAGISGACYAARRSVFRTKLTADAEDVELAQRSALHGYGAVVTAWTAVAFEQRVPDTIAQWLEYRLRRGRKYRRVVLKQPAEKDIRRGCLVHTVRTSQFVLVPFLALCSLASGLVLFVIGQEWTAVPLFAAAAFAVPVLPLIVPLGIKYGILRTVIGGFRWIVLIIFVLFVFQCSEKPVHVARFAQPDDVA